MIILINDYKINQLKNTIIMLFFSFYIFYKIYVLTSLQLLRLHNNTNI